MMINVLGAIVFLLFSTAGNAELSKVHVKKFSSLCMILNKKVVKKRAVCKCESENFKWLVGDSSWKLFEKLYFKPKKIKNISADQAEPLNSLIYEVTSGCHKKRSYMAPKARSLRAKHFQK